MGARRAFGLFGEQTNHRTLNFNQPPTRRHAPSLTVASSLLNLLSLHSFLTLFCPRSVRLPPCHVKHANVAPQRNLSLRVRSSAIHSNLD